MSENEVQTVTDDLDAFSGEFFGRNQEPIVDESQTSDEPDEVEEEAEQGEVDEPETDSQEEVDDTESEEEVEPEEEAPKPKPTVQDRINELVRQREEAKREGQAQLQALREEFEARIAALAPKQEAKPEPGEPTPDDLNDDGTNKYELGEFDPQYIRDLTRYTLNAERQKAEAEATERAQQTEAEKAQQVLVQSWNEKVEAAKVEYPDFQEKGKELLDGFNNLEAGYAQYLSTVLMSMDHGPAVLYYLSNNPAEAIEIVNSGAQKATLALGRIEAKFIDAKAEKTLAKPKVSKAPAPAPAAARSRGSNGAFVSVSPDTDDLDAFQKEFFKKK